MCVSGMGILWPFMGILWPLVGIFRLAKMPILRWAFCCALLLVLSVRFGALQREQPLAFVTAPFACPLNRSEDSEPFKLCHKASSGSARRAAVSVALYWFGESSPCRFQNVGLVIDPRRSGEGKALHGLAFKERVSDRVDVRIAHGLIGWEPTGRLQM